MNVVVLTGAGISAESGIRTFRASDGLWEEHKIDEVATPQGFARDAALVHRFYNARRAALAAVAPNAAHAALARFERRHDGDFMLVTQNIDDLHERAGSVNLRHMHGELLSALCVFCHRRHRHESDLSVAAVCPHCARGGGMRPDIVWFGEMPYYMDDIHSALARCDLFVSIGTSGNVYPAAGFVAAAGAAGARCVELNLEKSATASAFDDARYGMAGDIVPAFFDALSPE